MSENENEQTTEQAEAAETEGLIVGDEVHLVPVLRQRETQLGGDDPRATVRRVAGDPDLHVALPPRA